MDIWIIRDGEKTGPIHDFEVRRKIEAGELPATTPAWHEGLAAWKPLGRNRPLHPRVRTRPSTAAAAAECRSRIKPAAAAAAANDLSIVRRFWARWFDLYLFAGFWWLGMWAAGQRHRGRAAQSVGHVLPIRAVVRAGSPAHPPIRHHSRQVAARPPGRQQRRLAARSRRRHPPLAARACSSASASAGASSRCSARS